MPIESVFITGSNRGIGLELVKQFIALPTPPKVLIATCRDPENAKALQDLKETSNKTALHVIKLDVTNEEEIKAAAKYTTEILGEEGLTMLINNAGINQGFHPIPGAPAKTYMDHLQVNAVSPIIVTDNLLPLLKKAAAKHPDGPLSPERAAVITISAQLGTYGHVSQNTFLKVDAYRISKNAANHATAITQRNLKGSGILVAAICPGWMKTEMGGQHADQGVKEGVAKVLKTILNLDESHGGRLVNNQGELLEW